MPHPPLNCVQAGCLPPNVFAEALACLACLDIPGHDYAHLLRSTGIHTFLAELATAGGGGGAADQDSVLLGVVEATGVLCADEACAGMLASAGLVSAGLELAGQELAQLWHELGGFARIVSASTVTLHPALQHALPTVPPCPAGACCCRWMRCMH